MKNTLLIITDYHGRPIELLINESTQLTIYYQRSQTPFNTHENGDAIYLRYNDIRIHLNDRYNENDFRNDLTETGIFQDSILIEPHKE